MSETTNVTELTEELLGNIKNDIESSLPKLTGEIVQQRLALVDELEKKEKSLTKKIEKQRLVMEDLEKKINEQNILISKLQVRDGEVTLIHENNIKKSKELTDKELRLENTLLKTELKMTKESNDKVMMLTDKVFSIPTVAVSNTKFVNDTYDCQGYTDANGDWVSKGHKNGEQINEDTETKISR